MHLLSLPELFAPWPQDFLALDDPLKIRQEISPKPMRPPPLVENPGIPGRPIQGLIPILLSDDKTDSPRREFHFHAAGSESELPPASYEK